jgi:hypothetical protein
MQRIYLLQSIRLHRNCSLNVHKVGKYESISGRYANPDVSRNTDVATLSFSWIKKCRTTVFIPIAIYDETLEIR